MNNKKYKLALGVAGIVALAPWAVNAFVPVNFFVGIALFALSGLIALVSAAMWLHKIDRDKK